MTLRDWNSLSKIIKQASKAQNGFVWLELWQHCCNLGVDFFCARFVSRSNECDAQDLLLRSRPIIKEK